MQFEIPNDRKEELWFLLDSLLKENHTAFYGDFGNQFHIPATLFNGHMLSIRQYSSNKGRHWVLSGKSTGHRTINCSTSELFNNNILSDEFRSFIIKNIDLFEGI